ncbi:MAG: XRE family transcriptional regulator, partial [Desulfarculaceae bacterium]
SQIENDKASPSIAVLKRIAQVLGVRIVDFFMDDLDDDSVVRGPEQWLRVSLPGWKANIRQLVRGSNSRKMQPFYTVIEPGGGAADPYTHQGDEFGLVLEGELTLKVGSQTYQVPAGHSFYYSSIQPHSWVNTGEVLCKVVWVVSPPTW